MQKLERGPGRHGEPIGPVERGPTQEGRRKAERDRTQGAEGDLATQAGIEWVTGRDASRGRVLIRCGLSDVVAKEDSLKALEARLGTSKPPGCVRTS